MYPSTDISLSMLLCTRISNCSTELSFSALKRVNLYLRSSSNEDGVNCLAMMAIKTV